MSKRNRIKQPGHRRRRAATPPWSTYADGTVHPTVARRSDGALVTYHPHDPAFFTRCRKSARHFSHFTRESFARLR